ncbi:nuclear transport factor 2 family protein [Nocardioides sp. QY071]|uniref:nuclear transport factor 2 family protein n=1 Tax=Nocardioides sp. QY071 TaxID=3044187 RepID=UPI00249BE94D|nr:nuclear transport factor 2 family protein [Nocardioides sp. QY071]WGY03826.1 nuclear transport factor 2 family protein [Nocardioides sp. QY071]
MTAPGTLADRVARLEAVAEIKALKHRYLRACDAKDPAGFRAAFVAEGAVLDYGERIGRFEGADALVGVFEGIALRKVEGRYVVLDMHHALHADIDVLGATEATGRWTLRFRQVDLVAQVERVSAIEYDDGYALEEGEWRIARSAVTTLWTLEQPLADGFTVSGSLR